MPECKAGKKPPVRIFAVNMQSVSESVNLSASKSFNLIPVIRYLWLSLQQIAMLPLPLSVDF